ncbi:protein Ear1p [Monosporozyma servazzii]
MGRLWGNSLLLFCIGALFLPTNVQSLPLLTNQDVYVNGEKIEIIQYENPKDVTKNDDEQYYNKPPLIHSGDDLTIPDYPFDGDMDPGLDGESPDAYIILYVFGSVFLMILIANVLLWIIRCISTILGITRNGSRLSLYANDIEQQQEQQIFHNVLNDTDASHHNYNLNHNSSSSQTQDPSNIIPTISNYTNKKSKNNFKWSVYLDDPNEMASKVALLSPEEQFYYRQGEEYVRENPPLLVVNNNTSSLKSNTDDPNEILRLNNGEENSNGITNNDDIFDPVINEQTRQFIVDEGASAWEFQPDPNLPNDTIMVDNKTEVIFLNNNYDASVTTNLPIPCINRVYYCEFKIFEWNSNEISDELEDKESTDIISFGLASSPYPYFRLPGRHHNSIAYDSNGGRRTNTSFPLEESLATAFPKCEKGDVIGVGYRTRSGTIFFTRNGKKINEKEIGGHIRGWKFKYLYPCIGANIPCRIHANFGTYGFVYIEANVKKWGYARINGLKLPPPSYEQYDHDPLIESSGDDDYDDEDNEDDEAEDRSTSSDSNVATFGFIPNQLDGLRDASGKLLPPPPGFEYSTSPHSINEEISMGYLPSDPPLYGSSLPRASIHDSNISNSLNVQESPIRKLFNKVIPNARNGAYTSLSNQKDSMESSELQDSDRDYDDTMDLTYDHDIDIGSPNEMENSFDENNREDTGQSEYDEMSHELQRMIEREQEYQSSD